MATPDGFVAVEAAARVPDAPNVWTDGSHVLDQLTGVSSSGAGFFAHRSENCWSDRSWGHVDSVRANDGVPSCRGFCSVRGPSSLFKELRCGVSLWLCSHLMLCTWELTIWCCSSCWTSA